MTSEMRQLYIQHGKNYINIIKGWCSRDEENLLYNLSCNVLYVQQNYPATNQNQKQPSMSIYAHASNNILQLQRQKFNNLIHKNLFHRHNATYTQIRNIYWANSANDRSLAVKLRLSKNSYRQFQYRLPELVYEAGRAWLEPPQPIANIWTQ